MQSEKEQTLEEIFEELSEIVEQLEDREVSLEKSFDLYSKGMKKIKLCNDKIDLVEKKMLIIDEEGTQHEF